MSGRRRKRTCFFELAFKKLLVRIQCKRNESYINNNNWLYIYHIICMHLLRYNYMILWWLLLLSDHRYTCSKAYFEFFLCRCVVARTRLSKRPVSVILYLTRPMMIIIWPLVVFLIFFYKPNMVWWWWLMRRPAHPFIMQTRIGLWCHSLCHYSTYLYLLHF